MNQLHMCFTKDRFQNYMTSESDIDADHWEVIAIAKEVMEYLEDPILFAKDSSGFALAIEKFLLSLDAHMTMEENYMDAHLYPYRFHHKNEHIAFRLKVASAIKALKDAPYRIGFQDYKMLNLVEMYYGHIDHQDMQMVAWIKNHSSAEGA